MTDYEILKSAVSDLPELNQPIYQHSELSDISSQHFENVLNYIHQIHDALKTKLNRPLKILDLGCSQGFISLNMASWQGLKTMGGGDIDKGYVCSIDSLDKNIHVCKLLAEEHLDYKINFFQLRVEDAIINLQAGYYDILIGLNIFQNLFKQYGLEPTKYLIKILSAKVPICIFEPALKSEPFNWAASLPEDYREMFNAFDCVKLLAYNDTNISNVKRPLIFASNKYIYFKSLGLLEINKALRKPNDYLPEDINKRYFFCDDKFVKFYSKKIGDAEAVFTNAVEFLKNMDGKHGFPKFIEFENNSDELWIVRQNIEGRTLTSVINNNEPYDAWDIIKQTLNWLIILEQHGYYHCDLFPNLSNLVLDLNGKVHLIDYCSIVNEKKKKKFFIKSIIIQIFIFMYEILERKDILTNSYDPDPNKFGGYMQIVHVLKKYISEKKYLKLLNAKKFTHFYEVLFSNDENEEPEYKLLEQEIEFLEKYQSIKIQRLDDILVSNFDLANGNAKIIHDSLMFLYNTTVKQQKRIEELENRLNKIESRSISNVE